ncbi:MAG: hypothetical protein GF331_09865 [Chitinivibrionales bacterium]|nr:hypothetical protein [Chitinivibrionales bacterium]
MHHDSMMHHQVTIRIPRDESQPGTHQLSTRFVSYPRRIGSVVAYYRPFRVAFARFCSALITPFLRVAAHVLFGAPAGRPPRRILIQEGYRLGDILLFSPALIHLRRSFPDAELHLLSFTAGAELVSHAHWVDRVVQAKPFWAFELSAWHAFKEWRETIRALRRGRYDLAIDFRGDPRGLSLIYFAGIPHRISFTDFGGGCFCTRGYRTPAHIDHQMLRCCWLAQQVTGSAVTECDRPTWPPQPEPAEPLAADPTKTTLPEALQQEPVLIHPGTSAGRKLWPAQHFAHVIDTLLADGIACMLIGGRGDAERLNEIHRNLDRKCPILYPTFAQLAGLLASAKCVVCVDSFVQHVAWALNVPCVCLYGPGSPLQTAPLAGPVRIVWNNRVLEPPYRSWNRPRPMTCNQPQTVVDALEAIITPDGT